MSSLHFKIPNSSRASKVFSVTKMHVLEIIAEVGTDAFACVIMCSFMIKSKQI